MYSLSGVFSAQYSSQSLSVLLDNVIADSLVILMWKIGVFDITIVGYFSGFIYQRFS